MAEVIEIEEEPADGVCGDQRAGGTKRGAGDVLAEAIVGLTPAKKVAKPHVEQPLNETEIAALLAGEEPPVAQADAGAKVDENIYQGACLCCLLHLLPHACAMACLGHLLALQLASVCLGLSITAYQRAAPCSVSVMRTGKHCCHIHALDSAASTAVLRSTHICEQHASLPVSTSLLLG